MASITIGFPALSGGAHFTVTIKNSAGATVYGPAPQANTPFDPGLSDPDTYTMFIDNDGATNGWCFTISDCTTCPTLTLAEITNLGGESYYGNFTFDMSGGFQCPFRITGTTSGGVPFSFTINSLADFLPPIGSSYTKKFLIGGLTSLNYQIVLLDGTVCTSGSVAFECLAPVISAAYPTLAPDGLGGYAISTHYDDCGDTCHTMIWNYTQVLPVVGSPDNGTFTDTVTCPPAGPATVHTVHPVGYLPGHIVRYNVTATDCCGVVQSFVLSYSVPCDGPTIPPTLSIVFLGGNYYLRAIYSDCGDDCHDANFSVIQNNVLSSGINESFVNNANVIPCAGPFPLTIDYLLNPNLAISSGTNIRYFIQFTNCCGVNVDSALVTYPL